MEHSAPRTSADSQPTKLRGVFFWLSTLFKGEVGSTSLEGGNRVSWWLIMTVISFWIRGVAAKIKKREWSTFKWILGSQRCPYVCSSPFITAMGSSIWGLSRLIPITVAKFSTFILFTLEFSCTSNKKLKNSTQHQTQAGTSWGNSHDAFLSTIHSPADITKKIVVASGEKCNLLLQLLQRLEMRNIKTHPRLKPHECFFTGTHKNKVQFTSVLLESQVLVQSRKSWYWVQGTTGSGSSRRYNLSSDATVWTSVSLHAMAFK